MSVTMDGLFGSAITLEGMLARMAISFAVGLIMGLERRMRQRILGMRTLMLICVSSTLLMVLSIYVSQVISAGRAADPARIAAQVVSGIDFLGAGAIIHQGLNISGLTSAAVIWASAALGLAIGAGLVLPAVMAVVLFEFFLIIIERFEHRFFPAEHVKRLFLVFESKKVDLQAIKNILDEIGLKLDNTEIHHIMGEKRLEVTLIVKSPKEVPIFELVHAIKDIHPLLEYRFSD